MTLDLERTPVYLAGVAESPLGSVRDQSEFSMAALAAREALQEAGLSLRDVDGLFVNYMGDEGTVQFGEYLGIQPRYMDSTDIGGAAFEAFVHHALIAVATGRCEVALIAYASRQRSKRSRRRSLGAEIGFSQQFEAPYGLPLPIGNFALIAARHMHQYGTRPEHLAEVAVAARLWAQKNPKAWSREPLSIQDVLDSPMLSDPIRKADMCLITDGGGAVVITSAARARDAAKRPVRIIGAAESQTHWNISQMPDMTTPAGFVSGPAALSMAGLVPADVDVFEPYDASTISVLLHLEALGFCGKGESGAFVADGKLRPGGSLPSMTSGGGLSYCHPGALGLLLLVEAVRQLRCEAGDRQVQDPRIAVAHGMGGLFSTAATVVLARD